MEEIRFRFWHENKWFHFDLHTYPTYSETIWKALSDGERIYRLSGREDADKKPIYEGDILKPSYLYISEQAKPVIVRYGEYEQDGSAGEYAPVTCLGFYVEDEYGQQESLVKHMQMYNSFIIGDVLHQPPEVQLKFGMK